MWAENSVFYQIYPLGFCGAPEENDGVAVNRIAKVGDWAEHIEKLGANAVYLCPIFDSDRHGYDTGTTGSSIPVWAPTRISARYVKLSAATVSR